MNSTATSASPCGLLEGFLLRGFRSLRRELGYPDEAGLWITRRVSPARMVRARAASPGNLQHYIGAQLGQSGYVRDRAGPRCAGRISLRDPGGDRSAEEAIGLRCRASHRSSL